MNDQQTNRLNKSERADARWWGFYAFRWLIAAMSVVLLLGGIGLGWSRMTGKYQADTDAQIRRASFERQQTDRDLLSHKLAEWFAIPPTDVAHRNALTEEMCGLADEIRGTLTPAQSIFVEGNCR